MLQNWGEVRGSASQNHLCLELQREERSVGVLRGMQKVAPSLEKHQNQKCSNILLSYYNMVPLYYYR